MAAQLVEDTSNDDQRAPTSLPSDLTGGTRAVGSRFVGRQPADSRLFSPGFLAGSHRLSERPPPGLRAVSPRANEYRSTEFSFSSRPVASDPRWRHGNEVDSGAVLL